MKQDNDRVFPEIEEYMERHDFLPADRYKVRQYINQHDNSVSPAFRFTGGRLTRTDLIMQSRDLNFHIPRALLGLQINFI